MTETAAETQAQPDLSAVAIPLLKGVIYQESDAALWNALLNLQGAGAGLRGGAGLGTRSGRGGRLRLPAFAERRGGRRAQAAAAHRPAAIVVSGQPVAGAAAQEAGQIRRQRRR